MSTTTVTASIKMPCQITLQCEGCDHVFVLETVLVAESSSTYSNPVFGIGLGEKQARAKGETSSAVQSQMDDMTKRLQEGDCSMVMKEMPCPKCGYLQSWMAKNKRFMGIIWIFLALGWAAVVGIAWRLIHDKGDDPTIYIVIAALPALFGIVAGMNALVTDPNKNWFERNGRTKHDAPASRKPINVSFGYSPKSAQDGFREFSLLQSVEALVDIYKGYPEGIAHDMPVARKIRAIGQRLHEAGGMQLMLTAHEAFAEKNFRMKRNLEMLWNGVGDWMG